MILQTYPSWRIRQVALSSNAGRISITITRSTKTFHVLRINGISWIAWLLRPVYFGNLSRCTISDVSIVHYEGRGYFIGSVIFQLNCSVISILWTQPNAICVWGVQFSAWFVAEIKYLFEISFCDRIFLTLLRTLLFNTGSVL